MIRTLLIVAAVSLVLAVGCLAGVVASAGGPFWIDETGQVHRVDWRHLDDGDSADDRPSQAETGQRDFTGFSGHRLVVDLPADVTVTQGPDTRLTIRGPRDMLDQIHVHDGVIEADDVDPGDGRLTVTLTAPEVDHFTLDGDQTLNLKAYDHEQLSVDLSGSGHVSAQGRAKHAALQIEGSGVADLSALKLETAQLSLVGSGAATLAPTQSADIDVAGSGQVQLLVRPRSENIRVSGPGRVNQPDAR